MHGMTSQKVTDLQGWALPLVFPIPVTMSHSPLTAALKEEGRLMGHLTLPNAQRTE